MQLKYAYNKHSLFTTELTKWYTTYKSTTKMQGPTLKLDRSSNCITQTLHQLLVTSFSHKKQKLPDNDRLSAYAAKCNKMMGNINKLESSTDIQHFNGHSSGEPGLA